MRRRQWVRVVGWMVVFGGCEFIMCGEAMPGQVAVSEWCGLRVRMVLFRLRGTEVCGGGSCHVRDVCARRAFIC